jgi:ubiquinone/menaquinone biosynthesis C-methylase UbiE
MIEYNQQPLAYVEADAQRIASFVSDADTNMDAETVASFGEEWLKFNHFDEAEIKRAGDEYFDIISPEMLPPGTVAMDVGCGTGRWTKYISGKVAFVEAVDPSAAVQAAGRLVGTLPNVRVTQAGVDNLPFPDDSFGFVFSLGVLHHIPDTAAAMQQCVRKLAPGGHFMVYLYYDFENRGSLFKALFGASNALRKGISSMPSGLKKATCEVIAATVYMPFVLAARATDAVGLKKLTPRIPLSNYRNKSYNIIRNDALDRFGTPLEQRFSRADITRMMEGCGLTNIRISDNEPYWHAVGQKPSS